MAKTKSKRTEEEIDEVEIPLPNVPVSEEDKIQFFKAMLSDQPFVGVHELLGGALTVEFRALSVADNMQIYDQLKKDQFNNVINNDSNYLTALTCYRLALSLQKINGEAVFDVAELTARAKIVEAWPVFKVSGVTEAFKSFEDKIVTLTNAVSDANFWQAAKSSS